MMQFSKFRIEATRIAKKYEISMFLCTEEKIEIAELDNYKSRQFIKAIENLNSKTTVTDLIKNRQHIDTKGFDISNSKSLYLIDDNYYNEIVGNAIEEQITMF